MKIETLKKCYIVGANPCQVKKVFMDKKEAKAYCNILNEKARKYFYEIRTLDLVL